jgi:hypothetical protein
VQVSLTGWRRYQAGIAEFARPGSDYCVPVHRFGRRELLKRGASFAGAFAGARLLAACGSAAPAEHPSATDLKELDGALRGRVVLPSSPDYRAARLVWNTVDSAGLSGRDWIPCTVPLSTKGW